MAIQYTDHQSLTLTIISREDSLVLVFRCNISISNDVFVSIVKSTSPFNFIGTLGKI